MLKLCWNRKRAHALVASEVFFSFLVVFAVMTMAVYSVASYRLPLGYDVTGVLHVTLVPIASMLQESASPERLARETWRLLEEVKRLDGVEAAAGLSNPLYLLSMADEDVEFAGRRVDAGYSEATDDLARILRLNVTAGRWFEPADDALAYDPVVLNEHLRRTLFGDQDPLGQRITPPERPRTEVSFRAPRGGQSPREKRVVGVVEEYREDGELSGPRDYFFKRQRTTGAELSPIFNLVVRVRPGTGAAIEEALLSRLRAVSPGRTFQVEPVAKARSSFLRLRLVPLAALGLIAAFMLVMVALGMVGVLWQSVSRRRREIGLRRALGATGRGVSAQILGELLVITSAGLLLGLALVVQFPLLGIIGWVSGSVYATAIALSVALIYALAVVAALYPSRLAARVQPAAALHYE
jgi:putative ABC transport system permease protein